MITLTPGDLIALGLLAIGIAPCIFHIGKLTARVDNLEQWRRDLAKHIRISDHVLPR